MSQLVNRLFFNQLTLLTKKLCFKQLTADCLLTKQSTLVQLETVGMYQDTIIFRIQSFTGYNHLT